MGLKQTLLNAVGPRVAERGRVTAVQSISARFRFIDIASDKIGALSPTHKMQVNAGQWNVRTYTPMPVAAGQMRLLAYLHDHGPGSQWARAVAAGDELWFLGLKAALSPPAGVRLFVGDETTFSTALNLQAEGRSPDMKVLFEVTSLNEAHRVVEQLGLKNTALVERKADDAHWPTMVTQATTAMALSDHAVLAGSAQTIQTMIRGFKAQGLSSSHWTTKAYWSRLKTGLD